MKGGAGASGGNGGMVGMLDSLPIPSTTSALKM